jgi:hypothetical protein
MDQTTLDDYLPQPYFGKAWDAPITDNAQQVPTPVGTPCLLCEVEIQEGDRGVMVGYWGPQGASVAPIHIECQFRSVMGGANHIKGTCHCSGGPDDPDPPNLTMREEALAAVLAYEEKHNIKLFRDREET